MKKKLFKVLFMTMIFTAMLSISAFAGDSEQGEEAVEALNAESYSASGRREYITATGSYNFDSAHSIDVEAVVCVDYDWDEGRYGWVNKAYIYDISIGSDTVYADYLRWVDYDDKHENTCYEKIWFYGTAMDDVNFSEYEVYIKIHVRVDEWGEVDVWLQFTQE